MHSEYRPAEWLNLSGGRRQAAGCTAQKINQTGSRAVEEGLSSDPCPLEAMRERLSQAMRIVRTIQVRVDDEAVQSLTMVLIQQLGGMLLEVSHAPLCQAAREPAIAGDDLGEIPRETMRAPSDGLEAQAR